MFAQSRSLFSPEHIALHDFKELAVSSVTTRDFVLDFPKKHVWKPTFNIFDAYHPTIDSRNLDYKSMVERLQHIVHCRNITVRNVREVALNINDFHKNDDEYRFTNDCTNENKFALDVYRAIEKDCKHFELFDNTTEVAIPQSIEDVLKGARRFESLTCPEQLDYLKRCRWSAYDGEDRHKTATYEFYGNKPLHIKEHDIVHKVETINDCCKDVLPNLFKLKERMQRENPKGLLRCLNWGDTNSKLQLEEKFSSEIMYSIVEDNKLAAE